MQGRRDELLSMLQTITGWSREEVRAAFGRSGTAGGRRTNAAAGTPATGSTQIREAERPTRAARIENSPGRTPRCEARRGAQIHAEKARPKHARVEG